MAALLSERAKVGSRIMVALFLMRRSAQTNGVRSFPADGPSVQRRDLAATGAGGVQKRRSARSAAAPDWRWHCQPRPVPGPGVLEQHLGRRPVHGRHALRCLLDCEASFRPDHRPALRPGRHHARRHAP